MESTTDIVQHSPLPWKIDDEGEWLDANDVPVGRIYGPDDFPCLDPDDPTYDAAVTELGSNQTYATQAVNGYPGLVAAVEAALGYVENAPLFQGTEADLVAQLVSVLAGTPPVDPVRESLIDAAPDMASALNNLTFWYAVHGWHTVNDDQLALYMGEATDALDRAGANNLARDIGPIEEEAQAVLTGATGGEAS
jgi:hypothetical protein